MYTKGVWYNYFLILKNRTKTFKLLLDNYKNATIRYFIISGTNLLVVYFINNHACIYYISVFTNDFVFNKNSRKSIFKKV